MGQKFTLLCDGNFHPKSMFFL